MNIHLSNFKAMSSLQMISKTVFVLLIATTLAPISNLQGQGGLSGGIGGPRKKEDRPAPERNWDHNDPFDNKGKSKPASPKDSKPAQPKPLTLDQRLDRLQNKHDRYAAKRNSTQVIDNINTMERAEKTLQKYRDLIEREKQKLPQRKTWSGPGLPPLGGDRTEPWRKGLLDTLDKEWEEARALIKKFKEKKLQPGSIAEKIALNQINRELMDIYLAALRLRIRELQWQRELQQKPLRLALQTQQINFEFVAWENQPLLDKLPRGGGGIVPKLKQIKKMMEMKYGNSSLLATLQIDLNVKIWNFGNRNYELSLYPKSTPAPYIPEGMRKKPQLRLEARSISQGLFDFIIPITPDHLKTIREKGFVDISVAQITPIRRAQKWTLTGSNAIQIRVVALNYRPTKPDGSPGKPDTNRGASDKTNDKTQPSENQSGSDESKTDTDDKLDSDSEDQGAGKKSPSDKDKKKGDGNDSKTDENDSKEDDNGSKVGFDSDQNGNTKRSDSPPEKNDSDADDLLSDDINPNRKPPKKTTNKGRSREKSKPSKKGGSSKSKSTPGNWLTWKEVKNLPVQEVGGFWKDQLSEEPVWFQLAGKKLLVRAANGRETTLGIDANERGNSGRYFGIAYTVPKSGNCTKHGFWQPCALAVSAGEASGEWRGKKVDEETCKLSEKPDSGKLRFQRMQFVAFAPLAHGKLMHMTGSPSVGSQSSQFKATAKIQIQLQGILAVQTRVTMNGHRLGSNDGGKTFDFVTTRSGRHELQYEILENDGTVLHRDRIRIDVPGIRGIGR